MFKTIRGWFKLYKVVATDNYARETVADRVVKGRMFKWTAEALCEELRASGKDTDRWYVVREQSVKDWGGMSEFV